MPGAYLNETNLENTNMSQVSFTHKMEVLQEFNERSSHLYLTPDEKYLIAIDYSYLCIFSKGKRIAKIKGF